ncbi:MAG TPA: sugar ABC transporter permease [Bacillota bacterium]|nr:sugar ABC transporter permease [Bacillota bacterium]
MSAIASEEATLVAVPRARRRLGAAGLRPYLYILPVVASLGFWIYWPLLRTFFLGFYTWNLLPTTPRVWVGLGNYARVVGLQEMGIALRNTLIYVVGMLPLSVALPLGIALLTQNLGARARGVYRALIFMPMLMAPVVVATIWDWMLDPTGGLVDSLLHAVFGLGPVYWLNSQTWAIWVITAIAGWKVVGFAVLIFAAALTGVSREYLEAAAVDGAAAWQRTWHIVVPLILPSILLVVMLTVLLSAQWTFPLINVMTQGGPVNATTNIYFELWQFGFQSYNVGWASAAAVLLFLGFGVIAWGFTALMNRVAYRDS